eukprot:3289028-Rhodomonas_salina.1
MSPAVRHALASPPSQSLRISAGVIDSSPARLCASSSNACMLFGRDGSVFMPEAPKHCAFARNAASISSLAPLGQGTLGF